MADKIEMLDPGDVTIIGLDTEDREEHPLFDPRVFEPVNPNLVKNIMVYGVLQPVLVRQEAGVYYVVDGRQRVRAAREVAKTQGEAGEHKVMVPARILRGQDDTRVSGVMVSVNENRLDDNVLMKAKKASRLLSTVGDINAVAIAFGRSTNTIRNWLSLAEADPYVHAAVLEGKISAAAAIELADLPRDQQKEMLERLLRKGLLSEVPPEKAAPNTEGVPVEKLPEGEPPVEAPKPNPADLPVVSQSSVREAKSSSGITKHQKGVRRTWLRKALKTEAAKGLAEDQLDVIKWFCYGDIDEETWIGKFVVEAAEEIGMPGGE